jgi:UDP-N-acetylglucosamine--N-acetylmuramyl-(pentapeptide) pyrophosphoryl-undecaprenol N-acetylglucosamine transferase
MANPLIPFIAYVAGKSGGHIVPCLTLLMQWQVSTPHIPLFFTTDATLDQTIIQTSSVPLEHRALPLSSSYAVWYNKPVLAWHLFISFWISLYNLWKSQPIKLVTTGGLTAIPVCCAAYILRIPVELYELNAVPGRAAHYIGYIATHIFVCFVDAQQFFPPVRCSLVPYPIRYTEHEKNLSGNEIGTTLGFDSSAPTLCVLGGSQGSVRLNALMQEVIGVHKTAFNIIHQTGGTDPFDWHSWYKAHNVNTHVFAYTDNLAPYFAVSDLIICRAGAGTLFETVFFNKPCIIIPLEGAADDHQLVNAYAMQKQYPDVCVVLRQHEIEKDPTSLYNQIMRIINQQAH